jgi:hypothetical protein
MEKGERGTVGPGIISASGRDLGSENQFPLAQHCYKSSIVALYYQGQKGGMRAGREWSFNVLVTGRWEQRL